MSDTKQIDFTNFPEFIFGAEGEEDQQNDPTGESSGSSDQSGGDAGSEPKGSQKHDDADDPAVKGLIASVAASRADAKAEKKRADALQKIVDDAELATKSEIEQATAREEKANTKITKLAQRFLTRELNSAITAAAANFVDPSDAIAGVDLSELVYSQDEDDPADVTIDAKSVERAVKALAAKKPHFLKKGTEDGEATGSKFGAGNRQKKTSDDTYRETYPSL